jgi:hypothetical protein
MQQGGMLPGGMLPGGMLQGGMLQGGMLLAWDRGRRGMDSCFAKALKTVTP